MIINEKCCSLSCIKKEQNVIIAINFDDPQEYWVPGIVKSISQNQEPYDENGIKVRIHTGQIGHVKKISDFDITVVLGNVIDNAIIATSKLKANRRIDMSIKYLKEMLLIHLENTFDGDIHEKNNEILTLKTNKEHHGYGLKNIKHVLSKYDGIMEIYYSNKIFTSDIMMYVGNNSTATQKSGKAVNLV